MITHEFIGLNNHGCMHIMFLTLIDDMTNQKSHESIGLSNHRFRHIMFLTLIYDMTNHKSPWILMLIISVWNDHDYTCLRLLCFDSIENILINVWLCMRSRKYHNNDTCKHA